MSNKEQTQLFLTALGWNMNIPDVTRLLKRYKGTEIREMPVRATLIELKAESAKIKEELAKEKSDIDTSYTPSKKAVKRARKTPTKKVAKKTVKKVPDSSPMSEAPKAE